MRRLFDSEIDTLTNEVAKYNVCPDKYVYPFIIKEKNGKERTIITYNQYGDYGSKLRSVHEKILASFKSNFYQRNSHSFAYHENVRCSDALRAHMKSNIFIKLDIHHFFESITEEAFFHQYGEYFNKTWTNAIKSLFYKGALSIGFVTSPIISDFYMKKFDTAIEGYLENNPELHYSRYSDDILLSSELDEEESLNQLFDFVVEQLDNLQLKINEKKTKRMRLDYESHNSISFLGLNISKSDSVNNKVTISKRYILFILFLIAKQKGLKDHCYPLDNEIKSRIAYLAYNSPISFQRFQKKHINIYGEPYSFMPKELEKRSVARVTEEIPNFEEYSKIFKINIHKKIAGPTKLGFVMNDAIEIEKYIGKDQEVVEIPYFVDSIGKDAFKFASKVKTVICNKKLKNIDAGAFIYSGIEKIELPNSLRCIEERAFNGCQIKSVTIPPKVRVIGDYAFSSASLKSVTLSEGIEKIGVGAFSVTSLSHVDFPQSLKEIGDSAFENCRELKTTNIDKSNVQTIRASAFKGCVLLDNIVLPESLISIGMNAFYGCDVLKHVYIPASVLEVGNQAFKKCPNLVSLEVSPDNKIYEHREDNSSLVTIADKNLLFTSKETIDPDIKKLGDGVFAESFIKSIIIPDSVTSIGAFAFHNSILLKHVVLPNKTTPLGIGAFKGCLSLEEISIPETINKIPAQLFQDCPRLRKVNLPKEIVSIGDHAFCNDEKLQLELPNGLVSIGACAFKNCLSIKDIYVPASVKKIKKNAFLGLSQVLETIKVDPLNTYFTSGKDANVLVNYHTGDVLLGCKNSRIEQGVRCIYKYAFAYCDGLKSISLPDTVSKIEDGAFIGCNNLHEIKLGIVSKIGKSAFANTPSLESVVLPTSLTEIEEKAFFNSGLKALRFPNSIAKIGRFAFDNCKQLEELYFPATFTFHAIGNFINCPNIKHIEVDPKNQVFDSRDNCNAVIDTKSNTLIRGSASTVIPDTVEVIGPEAFAGIAIKSIVIPNKVKQILKNAFLNCSSLEEVTINNNIVSQSMFENCINLKRVSFGNSAVIKNIAKGAFKKCISLESITFPDSLEFLEQAAFSYSGLTEAVFPASIKSIPSDAFANCKNLRRVVIPKEAKMIEIGSSAFLGCSNLTDISLPDTLKVLRGYRTFAETAIKSIVIPEGCLSTIEGEMFANCHNLEEVTLPNNIEIIEAKAFYNDENLKHINIPDGVKLLGDEAFKGCSNLESISLPNTLETIGIDCFMGCTKLTSIFFPDSLKTINSSAFADCPNLMISSFPDGLQTIGLCAFKGNKAIKEIALPAGLVSLGNTAFIETNLEHITVNKNFLFNEANFDDEGKDVITFIDKNGEKHLILGCKNSIIPDDVKYIDSYAFSKIEGLETIDLPDSLVAIKSHAFYRCDDLKEIICPPHLLTLESHAFDGCSNLKRIVLNNKINFIGVHIFGDIKVDDLYIPASLTHMESLPEFNTISIDANNPVYTNYGNKSIYDKQNKSLLYAGENVAIPVDCVTVAPLCFMNVKQNKVFVPEGVVNFDPSFENSGVIEEMHLPSTVKRVGFGKNTYIKKIFVDKNNPYLTTSEDHKALLDVTRTNLIYLCEDGAIPECVTIVRPGAIRNDAKELHLPASFTKFVLVPGLMEHWRNINKITVSDDNPIYKAVSNAIIETFTNKLVFINNEGIIPEGVERLNKQAFAQSKIKSLYIPKSVKYMEINCFEDIDTLESIEVDRDNPIFDSRNNCNGVIITDKNVMIARCKNTVMPEGVTPGRTMWKSRPSFITRTITETIGINIKCEIKDSGNNNDPIFDVSDDDLPF